MSSVNPAQLSLRLERLFLDGARVAELSGRGDPEALLPAEAAFLGRSVARRAQEFAAGRVCARRALTEFGFKDRPIERAPDRQPIWPSSMVGSITHTAGFSAAVVAERACIGALGIDSEAAASVKPELWRSICLPTEIDWLATLPVAQRAAAATLIFSAKEAFYKCQYPLARQTLGFQDAHVQISDWEDRGGAFTIAATRPIAFAHYAVLPLRGHYLFHEEFVTTGLSVAAVRSSADQ